VDAAEPVFRSDDEAVLRGAMAFETMRVYDGVPFLLDRHLKRFAGSIEALALRPAEGVEEVLALASSAAQPDHVLRLYRSSLSLVATAAPLPANLEELRARGVALRTVDAGSPSALIAHAKATSYAASFAATRYAIAQGDDDAVLVSQGRVLDAPTANVWARLGDDLLTPPLGAGVLPGVTRSFLLEVSDAKERELAVEELYDADELFITSSIREVMPVTSIDGRPVTIGPAAARLQAELRSAT
jgi:branched-subunit amino acid aminotransferase/4-amino-4-deoxychorismate lyase